MLFGNYLYADKKDNIFYVYNAAVPIRNDQFDWTKPVDGSDPRYRMAGVPFHGGVASGIRIQSSGWIQNCNGTPFLSSAAGRQPQVRKIFQTIW